MLNMERAHGKAPSMTRQLRKAVGDRSIAEEDFAQHSRWCNSDNSFGEAVFPAREAASGMVR
jgi:hypothetical protein